MNKYQAVVFDLDGTLIDSESVFKAVAKITANEFNEDFSDELYLSLAGRPGNEVQRGIRDAFGADFPLDTFRERFEVIWTEHVGAHGIAQKNGAVALLEQLDHAHIPYAVATSTPHDRAQRSLELAGIGGRIEIVIGGDQVIHGKPAPDIYILAADRMGIAPNCCIAIEDSKVGVRAAAAANMYTIMIPDIKPPDQQTKRLASEIQLDMTSAGHRIFELLQR